MRRRLMILATVVAALAMLTCGSWWVWRTWYAEDQIRAAVEAEDVEHVALLIKLGAPVEVKISIFPDRPGQPVLKGDWPVTMGFGRLLHWTVLSDNLNLVKLLLANGADPNAITSNRQIPLHFAARNANLDIVKLLLGNLAKVNAKDSKGNTPLHWIWEGRSVNLTDSGKLAVVKLLLVNGADIEAKNKDGKTPLDRWPELAEIIKQVENEQPPAPAKAP